MPTFLIAFIVPMVIGLWAQHRVKSTFARNLEVPASHGMTGAEVARRILDSNGLHEVPIEETPGSLSDHYDPRSRSVHLSPEVFSGRSIASTAVGSHEVGHALQHAKSYAFFKFRSALAPAVQFTSNIWLLFLIGGIFLNILGFIYIAVALYSVAVLFTIVTLPVEFNASQRAKTQLNELGLVPANESEGVKSVLSAAAWTYVAGALAAVAMLLYYLSLLSNR
ncbi:MAG: zinc metallopeptidase [Actinobacteria bacterium]|nr:zinc metallopeptidase [Actinomycetota bacterium]MBA3561474.1 zinc metallopeptidase [Actinomycetota bacterium]MBA3566081.1 zinc metallopeptidase [Actinomycetota bacterium]MDQ3086558.1 zinc metallopeptidase [Actinomycetota bacterium]MDQ3425240.1 zinc metallopeptidase [Actinomycetota bacterium]